MYAVCRRQCRVCFAKTRNAKSTPRPAKSLHNLTRSKSNAPREITRVRPPLRRSTASLRLSCSAVPEQDHPRIRCFLRPFGTLPRIVLVTMGGRETSQVALSKSDIVRTHVLAPTPEHTRPCQRVERRKLSGVEYKKIFKKLLLFFRHEKSTTVSKRVWSSLEHNHEKIFSRFCTDFSCAKFKGRAGKAAQSSFSVGEKPCASIQSSAMNFDM